MKGPPRIAEWLLTVSAPHEEREEMLGDLAEEYATHRLPLHGPVRAAGWYWAQTIRSLPSNLIRRRRGRRAPITHRSAGDAPMQMLWQDVRYAVRTLRRNIVFAALAVGTLGLGIGATTLVYSVVDGVVLRPFPYPEPDRLIGIGPAYPRLNRDVEFREVLSPAEYLDIASQSRTLRHVVAWDMGNRHIAGSDAPERLLTGFWWGDAFATLGVAPALGRGFLPEETRRSEPVAVISHRLWLRRFAGDPGVIGQPIHVNGEPYTVVGVMPPRTLVYGTDLWLPMWGPPERFPRAARQFQVLARLAPGATLEGAAAELATIAARTEREHVAEFEEYAGWRLVPATWTDINVRSVRPAALILLAAVAFLLLLVCVNVASLLLARSAGRRREIAVRTAVGAGRGRVVRQLLTESVLLALLGCTVGVALAFWGTESLSALLPTLGLPIPGNVTLNGRVLSVSVLVAVAAGLLFGLAPALQASRVDIQGMLKSESTGSAASGGRHRLQRIFVGVEVALALVLLAAGGLLVNSFLRLQRVDPGFDTRNVLTMRLTLPRERYEGPEVTAFFQDLSQRVGALPGVRAVGVGSQFAPDALPPSRFRIEGSEARDEGALPTTLVTLVDDQYFRTLGIPLLRGRVPDSRDTEGTPLVAAINAEAARRYFPDQDPLGRRIVLDGVPNPIEIVGVVGSVRNAGLEHEPEPEVFGSVRQAVGVNNQLFLLVRSDLAPRALLPLVQREVLALDPDQPVYAVRTVEEAFAEEAGPRRAATLMLTLFGGFALVLAAIGIYGVVAYAVSERTREIGVRMALGARAVQVRQLVVRQAMFPVVIGSVAGLIGALAVGRLMGGLLYGVEGTDATTIASVALLLAAVALLASYLPARRASRLDPVTALREE